MAKELRVTIKEITRRHLKKYKSQVFGQNLTGVGWVAGTLPKLFEKDGVIELPMADVAGGGIVTGSALMGKRPIYIIRYQGYNWFNCIFRNNKDTYHYCHIESYHVTFLALFIAINILEVIFVSVVNEAVDLYFVRS